jgi:hypothetical protein
MFAAAPVARRTLRKADKERRLVSQPPCRSVSHCISRHSWSAYQHGVTEFFAIRGNVEHGCDSTYPIAEESIPPGKTLYVKIDIGIPPKRPETGIFIPQGFYAGGAGIDIILYFHGFDQPGVVSIDQYFKADYGKLREGVNSSGRNVVLVAPTLGPKSQAGTLVGPGGLDGFLSEVRSAIWTYGQLPKPPNVFPLRNLILACPSGGGAPVREMAGGSDDALGNLRESWAYDSLNSTLDVPFWSGWLRNKTADRLFLYYLPNGSEVAHRCETLKGLGLPNLMARRSNAVDHMHVPITHWASSLEEASFLEMRPGVVPAGGEPEV